MKKLLIVATMLFTTTAFAGGTMGGNPGKWYADHDVETIKVLVETCKK